MPQTNRRVSPRPVVLELPRQQRRLADAGVVPGTAVSFRNFNMETWTRTLEI